MHSLIKSIVLAEIDPYTSILNQNLTGIGTMINVGRDRTAINKSNLVQYSAILDRRVCPLCKKLDGAVFENNSPEYYKFMPRVHHNCRCIYVYISKDESRQPKIFIPSIDEDLLKLGSLISETVSTGGAVAMITTTTSPILHTKFVTKEIEDYLQDIEESINGEEVLPLIIDQINNLDSNLYPTGLIEEYLKYISSHTRNLKKKDLQKLLLQQYRNYLEDAFDSSGINFIFGKNLKLDEFTLTELARQYQVIVSIQNRLKLKLGKYGDFKSPLMDEYKIRALPKGTQGMFTSFLYKNERKLEINLGDFKLNLEESRRKIERSMNSNWSIVPEGENIDFIDNKIYTLIHEMGHGVDWRLNDKNAKDYTTTTGAKYKKYSTWSEKNNIQYDKNNNSIPFEKYPSQYSKTNGQEAFAECFTDLVLSKEPTEMSKLIADKLGIDKNDLYMDNLLTLMDEIDF